MVNKIHIYADTSEFTEIEKLNKDKNILGFTTNPSLMKKAKIKNYKAFSLKVLRTTSKPVSLEVFGDTYSEMYHQAKVISSWSKNAFVKIPIVNTKNLNNYKLIEDLNNLKIKLNITAVFNIEQVKGILKAIKNKKITTIISIFSGRIADTGRNPEKLITDAKKLCKKYKNVKILWASTREIYNFYQAQNSGADIITIPPNIYNKLKMKKYNLRKLCLETVKMFFQDAKKTGYKL